MTLEAQPLRIRQFGDQLGDLAADTTRARTYLADHVELGGSDLGLLHLVVPLDNATSFAVGSMIGGIQGVLHDCAPALRRAAHFYETTDRAQAQRMDARYEQLEPIADGDGYDLDQRVQDTVPLEDGGSSTNAADGAKYNIEHPSELLQHPYPDRPIERDLLSVASLTDWLDPVDVIRKGLEWVFHDNPGEEVAQWLLGDWLAVAEAGVALGQLAEWSESLASEVETAQMVVGFFWRGVAAGAAQTYFEQFAATVQTAGPSLRDTGECYRAMAYGMRSLGEVVGDGVPFCEDKLIAIGVKALAGALLAETVVGSLLFGAWAISDAKKCVDRFAEMVGTYEEVKGLVESGSGAGAMFISSLPGVDALPLPSPYQHPGTR